MGIRDYSYHSMNPILTFNGAANGSPGIVRTDSSGTVYFLYGLPNGASSQKRFFTMRKSTDTGKNWTTINVPLSESFYENFHIAPDDKIYIVSATGSNLFVYASSDKGANWTTVDSHINKYQQGSLAGIGGFAFSASAGQYAVFYSFNSCSLGNFAGVALRVSTTGASGTFSNADFLTGSLVAVENSAVGNNVCVSPTTGKVFYAVVSGSTNTVGITRSGTVATGFVNVDLITGSLITGCVNTFADVSGNIYVGGYSGSLDILRKSTLGATGTFNTIASGTLAPTTSIVFAYPRNLIYGTNPLFQNAVWSSTTLTSSYTAVNNKNAVMTTYDPVFDIVYVVAGTNGGVCTLDKVNLTSNSASIGPIFFGTSFGYANDNSLINSSVFGLANVAEWSHAGGLFQMKNMILGTLSSGKIGKNTENLIQIKHVGSTVQIMWPQQANIDNSHVAGYGDLSFGQAIGKLSTDFVPGDFIDVTEFDHVSLYCYLQKQTSGTLDDVVIQIERKPLTNVGFTTEQTVSYTISGSFVEARSRDLQFKKEINYGDLSIKEIGWPIDVPLTNVKQVRISAKHQNGQVDDKNANFIVYGRFIKSDLTKGET